MTDIKQLENEVADIVAKMHNLTRELQHKLDEIRCYKPVIPKPKNPVPLRKPPEPLGNRYIRAKELLKILGVCNSTLWRWVQLGKFPKGRKLGPSTTAWLGSDIDEWLENQ